MKILKWKINFCKTEYQLPANCKQIIFKLLFLRHFQTYKNLTLRPSQGRYVHCNIILNSISESFYSQNSTVHFMLKNVSVSNSIDRVKIFLQLTHPVSSSFYEIMLHNSEICLINLATMH